MLEEGAAGSRTRVKLMADYFYLKRQVIAPLGERTRLHSPFQGPKNTEVEKLNLSPPFSL